MKRFFKKCLRKAIRGTVLEIMRNDPAFIESIFTSEYVQQHLGNTMYNSKVDDRAKLYAPYNIINSSIAEFTYVGKNSRISLADIGKFCSIGPNFYCGHGIHPLNGISTAPMFYSSLKQNGVTLSTSDKVTERTKIVVGNDVFIGMNVTVLDGISIGDGAVIGAGAVVSKDIPPYAIAIGNPIKVLRYRFDDDQIDALLKIQWWNFDEHGLREVEKHFFDVERFLQKYYA